MEVDGEDEFFEAKNTRESSGMKVDEELEFIIIMQSRKVAEGFLWWSWTMDMTWSEVNDGWEGKEKGMCGSVETFCCFFGGRLL